VFDRLAGRRPDRDDRGAVAVTVAILMASGVLLGFLALVVDVGQIYAERSTLQAGADAAALGIARECAAGRGGCTEQGVVDLAARYAGANSPDGVTNIVTVCGEDNANVLGACPPPNANLTACLGQPPDDRQWVEVRVSTELADGRLALPPAFARTMAGNGGYDGASVGACARASWGQKLSVLAITISICEFNAATNDGTTYANPDGLRESDEYVIQFWNGAMGPCVASTTSGTAGFLNGSGNDCEIGVSTAGEVTGTYLQQFVPYATAPQECRDRVRRALNDGATIYLPVYNAVAGTGTNLTFTEISVVPFRVTAFQFGAPPSAGSVSQIGYNPEDWRDPSTLSDTAYKPDPCGTGVVGYRCLTGAFVGQPVPIDTIGGGNTQITLVG
jgi:hypothetical protein